MATDAEGQVTELADYYPYGEDRVSESTNEPTNYRFTDQEKDTETGLYYYGARYYNPVIGRFISLDPWQGDLADPQSLNKYSYARNNPLKYIDPSGETFLEFSAGFAYQFVDVMAIGILPPILQQSPADMLQGALTGNIIGGMVGAMEVVAGVVGGTAGTGGGLVLCPVTVGAGCGAAALSAGAGIAVATHGTGAFMTAITQTASGGSGRHDEMVKQADTSKVISTPDTHPDDFVKLKGDQGWRNKKTGETFKKSHTSHKGDKWKVLDRSTKGGTRNTNKESGKRKSVDAKGNIVGN